MTEWFAEQGVYIFRILLAGLCGIAIGAERQSRMKSAGVRTHFMVAVASALMMMISKFGFMDVIAVEGVSVDVSRVAAGIITGIGIFGGGLIFTGKQGLVSGMSTASGVWVTVGIGMAMGAGMYTLGIFVTLLILAMQLFFHMHLKICREPLRGQLVFATDGSPETVGEILEKLESMNMEVSRVKTEVTDGKVSLIRCSGILKPGIDRKEFARQLAELETIVSYEIEVEPGR